MRQKWPSGSHVCWCDYVCESRYGFLCMIYNRTACGVSPGLWRGSISAKSCFIILHLVISLLMYHLLAVCLNLMPLLPFILFCSPFFLLVSKPLLSPSLAPISLTLRSVLSVFLYLPPSRAQLAACLCLVSEIIGPFHPARLHEDTVWIWGDKQYKMLSAAWSERAPPCNG